MLKFEATRRLCGNSPLLDPRGHSILPSAALSATSPPSRFDPNLAVAVISEIRRLDMTKEFEKIPYMTRSTLTSKHQTTIPKVIVETLKLRASDQLIYEIEADGRVLLTAKTGSFASVAEHLSRKKPQGAVRSVDDMKAAVKSMANPRFSRAKP